MVRVIVVFSKTESLGGGRHNTEAEYDQSEYTAQDDQDDGEGVEVPPS